MKMGGPVFDSIREFFETGGAPWAFAVVGIFMAILGFAAAAEYVLIGIGYMRVFNKRGLKGVWKVWVPIAQSYALGEICGIVPIGQKVIKKPAKWYMLTSIGGLVIAVAEIIVTLGMFAALPAMSSGGIVPVDSAYIMFSLLSLLFSAAASGLGVWATIFVIFIYIRIFRLFDKKNQLLYILLSIFVPLAFPICLIIVSKNTPIEYYGAPPTDGNANYGQYTGYNGDPNR
ncbi:MAG: hypothetical protein LBS99_03270 [Clostridiales bacterium]|jgi:hypothetical protein|nr:hypothetical protein [Clostridiales bacterium]